MNDKKPSKVEYSGRRLLLNDLKKVNKLRNRQFEENEEVEKMEIEEELPKNLLIYKKEYTEIKMLRNICNIRNIIQRKLDENNIDKKEYEIYKYIMNEAKDLMENFKSYNEIFNKVNK